MLHGRAIVIAALLMSLGCSAGLRETGPPTADTPLPHASEGGVLPIEAFNFLAASAVDSCAVCARELRDDAFSILDHAFRPGRIVRSDGPRSFLRGASGANEIILSSWQGEDPRLTFRFHTIGDHLIGIAETELTDETIADRCRSLPEGASFDGVIEIVPFAYGDGAAYLYSPASRHLQVQCRIVAIDSE